MTSLLKKILASLITIGMLLPINGFSNMGRSMRKNPKTATAWAAWEQGDLENARKLSEELITGHETSDAGHFILSLIAHVQGDHQSAIKHQAQISPKYEWLSFLDEPVLWSYIHSGDIKGALDFAVRRNMPESVATRLKVSLDKPFSVELDGVIILPFTDDKLSPYMPGFKAVICGQNTVVRLDTGGSFVNLSSEQADKYGIKAVVCGEGFSSLTTGKICYGTASELTLGSAVLRNVPVFIHYGTLSSKGISDAFGVELGPIIGTNILQQFLTTIDGPGKRMILSKRANEKARNEHINMISNIQGNTYEQPFAMWSDHYMIVDGRANSRSGRFFVDTGLVVANGVQGQAAMLASHETLKSWNAPIAETPMFPQIPGEFCIGPVCRKNVTAFPVEDNVWENFGDWGGIDVTAMVSWGFLSHYVWTLDFDRYIYTLIEPAKKAE